MNLATLFVFALFGLLLAGFFVFFAIAVTFNIKAGKKYRKNLAAQVEQLRLGRMLSALGIDTAAYLHSEPGLEIRNHINRCAECRNTDTCDAELTRDEVSAENIGYCNNETDLKQIIDKQ